VCLFKLKNLKPILLGVIAAMTLICASGCEDDEEHAAVKQARQTSARALEIIRAGGDVETAREELHKALRLSNAAGDAKDPAVLLNADLTLEQARELEKGLDVVEQQITRVIGEISTKVIAIKTLQTEQADLKSLLSAGDTEIATLTNMLLGDSEKPGLKTQLANNEQELQDIQQQIQQLQISVNSDQNNATRLQAQANNLLQQAELAKAEEKIRLQRQAYNILLGRTGPDEQPAKSKIAWLTMAQEKQDQISLLQSRARLIEPKIKRLQNDIAIAEEQIARLQDCDQRRQMASQLEAVQTRITNLQQNIPESTSQLETAKDNYNQQISKIAAGLGDAKKAYSKGKSSEQDLVVHICDLYSADCSYKTALVFANSAKFLQGCSIGLQNLAVIADRNVAEELAAIAERFANNAEEQSQKAMENYDIAAKAYDKLQRQGQRRKDKFACTIIKNHILTLCQKADLAWRMGNGQTFDEAISNAQELAEQARNCDADFDQSIVADLLERLIAGPEEAPSPEVTQTPPAGNIDAIKDQLRQQLTEFMQLLPEEKIAALAEMTQSMQAFGATAEQIAAAKEMIEQGQIDALVELMAPLMSQQFSDVIEGAGSIDALITQLKPGLKVQFEQLMQMPEDQRNAAINQMLLQMQSQGLSSQQISAVKEMLEQGRIDELVDFTAELMAQAMQQMQNGFEQMGQEMKNAFEEIGEDIDSEITEEDIDFEFTETEPHELIAQTELTLDGAEVTVQITSSPGVKALALRIYSPQTDEQKEKVRKQIEFFTFDDEEPKQVVLIDAVVITDEGIRCPVMEQIALPVEVPHSANMETSKYWNDGKSRNIAVQLKISEIDENKFIVSIFRCSI